MDDFRRRPVNRVHRPTQPTAGVPDTRPADPDSSESKPGMTTRLEQKPTSEQAPVVSVPAPQSLSSTTDIAGKPPKRSLKRLLLLWGGVAVGILLLAIGVFFFWYTTQLSPVNADDTTKQLVEVESGTTLTGIAEMLHEKGLIRSATVFLWYTKLEGVQNNLQAGSYRLSPSESTPEIVEHLTSGNVDTFTITLYPGATLVDTTDKADDKKLDVTTSLKKAGYTEVEITAGLSADYSEYNQTLFQGRPQTADLEGYVYGETYHLSSGASVEDILRMSFDEYWKMIEENDLVAKYKAQGFTLYEGITLASIIQREAGSTPDDMAQISQVFHSRLAIGMPLGSDPTYQYIADKLGVPRDTNLDSPYNTRRYAGLPPGPIASAGEKALVATANPAEGDYLYFLSGDDNVTYFAHTFEEHEQNIANHCQKKCQIL